MGVGIKPSGRTAARLSVYLQEFIVIDHELVAEQRLFSAMQYFQMFWIILHLTRAETVVLLARPSIGCADVGDVP